MPVELETPPALDDIFLHETPLRKRARFYPLGFPLELATNSEAVVAAARQSWGSFPAAYAETPLSFCLTVTEQEGDGLPPMPRFRTHGHLMAIAADARNQVICDFSRGCAYGWVTRRVAEETEFLRLSLMGAPVMTLLVAAHLAALHSAFVMRNGVGVALCGESFAGKSTLAFACARRGWTLVADDGIFLVRKQEGRYAVGNPYSVRLREDAKSLFPELENCRAAARPNGKWVMEVSTSELGVSTANGGAIEHMVFLRRASSGAASMNRFDAGEALAFLEQATLYGPDDVKTSQRQAYRRLLGANIWELHYSNFADAVELLNRLGAAV